MPSKKSISEETRKEIARRAYFIWERAGHPHGRDAEHWAEAEAEILSEQPQAEAVKPSPATPKPVKKADEKKPAAAKKASTKAPKGDTAKPKAEAAKPAKAKKAVKTKSA